MYVHTWSHRHMHTHTHTYIQNAQALTGAVTYKQIHTCTHTHKRNRSRGDLKVFTHKPRVLKKSGSF